MKKLQLVGIFVGVLALGGGACKNQNPYPADLQLEAPRPPGPDNPDPTPDNPGPAAFTLDVPAKVDFREGVAGGFKVVGKVPSPGKAVLRFDGLPKGAKFDAGKSEVSWTPDLDAGHDPANPEVFFKQYEVTASVQSNRDPLTIVRKPVALVVWNVPKPMNVLQVDSAGDPLPGRQELTEDVRGSLYFKVVSPDFPAGPFVLRPQELPAGATLSPVSGAADRFRFDFTPDPQFVTYQNSSSNRRYYRDVELRLVGEGPRATTFTQDFTFRVFDARHKPEFNLPSEVKMSYGGSFSVVAEDLNGERRPLVELEEQPPFGKIVLQDVSDLQAAELANLDARLARSNPVTVRTASWIGVPDSAIGTSADLKFRACVYGQGTGWQDLCVPKTVKVTFEGKPRLEPKIERSSWLAGEVKFFRVAESKKFGVRVTDPNGSGIVSVEIEPEAMKTEVSFRSGTLTVDLKTAATKVFTLVAKNVAGLTARETFSMRAFPKDWAKTILLGETLRDSEIQSTAPYFKDAQIVNPALTPLNEDTLALRKRIFVTTSAIKAGPQTPQEIGSMFGLLGWTFVSSPVIGKIPRLYFPDDLIFTGRYADLEDPAKPSLNALSMTSKDRSVFPPSAKPVRLGQSLTSESVSPLVFSVRKGGECRVLLSLTKDTFDYPVAVECDVPGKGKSLYAGFEWADMIFDQADKGLGQVWLDNWMGLPVEEEKQ